MGTDTLAQGSDPKAVVSLWEPGRLGRTTGLLICQHLPSPCPGCPPLPHALCPQGARHRLGGDGWLVEGRPVPWAGAPAPFQSFHVAVHGQTLLMALTVLLPPLKKLPRHQESIFSSISTLVSSQFLHSLAPNGSGIRGRLGSTSVILKVLCHPRAWLAAVTPRSVCVRAQYDTPSWVRNADGPR